MVAVTVGTLDQPEKAPAIHHNFASEKIAWVHLDEHLPMKDRWWKPAAREKLTIQRRAVPKGQQGVQHVVLGTSPGASDSMPMFTKAIIGRYR